MGEVEGMMTALHSQGERVWLGWATKWKGGLLSSVMYWACAGDSSEATNRLSSLLMENLKKALKSGENHCIDNHMTSHMTSYCRI